MKASPRNAPNRFTLLLVTLIVISLGCGDDPTDPTGGGGIPETIPPLTDLETALFRVQFGTTSTLTAESGKAIWDPGREPISPVVAGLRVEVRDIEVAVEPTSQVQRLTGFWRLTDMDARIRYLPRCRVDSLPPDSTIDLDGEFLGLLPDSSTAWRPWQCDHPAGADLAFTFEVSWSRSVVAYHISADSVYGKPQIYLSDPYGHRRSQLTHDDSYNTSPQVSPDGTKILFASSRSSFQDRPQFWTFNADGTGLHRVAYNFRWNALPRWSPDGNQIVYQKLENDIWYIFLMDADGLNHRNLSGEIGGDFYPTFSADGNKIIFRSNRQGPGLYIMNPDGSNKRKWLDYPVYEAVWSPDGLRLSFRAGQDDIYVTGVDGTGLRNLTLAVDGYLFGRPAWSPDSQRLLFECQTEDGGVDIYRINRDGTDQVLLIHEDAFTCHQPSWGPRL